MQFVPRIRSGGKKMVVLVGVGKGLLPVESLRQRTLQVFNLDGGRLDAVRPVRCAHHLTELGQVLGTIGRRMDSGNAAAFADEASQAVQDIRVHQDLSYGAVE